VSIPHGVVNDFLLMYPGSAVEEWLRRLRGFGFEVE
jgi:hypothetical protein